MPSTTDRPAGPPGIAGVVLAAGASSRFTRGAGTAPGPGSPVLPGPGAPAPGRPPGGSKAFLRWDDGATLAARAVAALRGGGCAPVLVVLRAEVDPESVAGAVQVVNPRADEGLSTSLRAGLDAVARGGAEAVVVTLADTPIVGAEHVRRLVAAATGVPAAGALAVASYAGARRTPVLLGRAHWGLELAGDRGAGPWLHAHPELVTPVDCTDLGAWRDIDTWDDYLAARQR